MDEKTIGGASGEELDEIGARFKLPRITVKGGHSFDEDDESYRRRLLAQVIGAEVAGAASRPAVVHPSRKRVIRRR